MPLAGSAPVLSAAIRAAMIADPRTGMRDDSTFPTEQKALTAFCDVIAQVVLAHIAANAVVTMPTASIQVAGSPAAQANPLPCLGVLT